MADSFFMDWKLEFIISLCVSLWLLVFYEFNSFYLLVFLQALKHLSQALRLVSGFSSLVSYLALSSLFLVSSIREFLFSCFWACLCACVILCSPVYLEISVFASGL